MKTVNLTARDKRRRNEVHFPPPLTRISAEIAKFDITAPARQCSEKKHLPTSAIAEHADNVRSSQVTQGCVYTSM